MKNDLMVNLKEYFIKLKKGDIIFNAVEYYEIVKRNQNRLKQIIKDNESEDYEITYKYIDDFSCKILITFGSCESEVTYILKFTSYGFSYYLDISKKYELDRWGIDDEEITKESRIEWEGSFNAYKISEIQEEIGRRKEYILGEQKRLKELEDEILKYTT